jgi:hypothetical protein
MQTTPAADEVRGRQAAWAFGALLVGALAFYLVIGRDHWFFSDDWGFIATRSLTDVGDLLEPRNDHWSTMPIVVYRVLWNVFGLRTYLPYQALVVVLHLTCAVLLRTLARKSGAGPWVATLGAASFVLFVSGFENILWAIQVSYLGSLCFGLAQLVLADHDGRIDRRDWFGLACGFVCLISSGVGITLIVVVGIAALARRGWRVAAFHTVPLGVIYLVWWVTLGTGSPGTSTPGEVLGFVASGVGAAFATLGQVPGAGWALALLLVGGLVLRWWGRPAAELRVEASAPLAMLAGAVAFLVISGIARAGTFGTQSAGEPRYYTFVVALGLPALILAADAVWRRWRVAGAVAVALLLVGIPGNLAAVSDVEARTALTQRSRDLILALPRVPAAATAPDDLRPGPEWYVGPDLTMGWLRAGVEEGWLPDPGPIDPVTFDEATFRLSLYQTDGPDPAPGCPSLEGAPVVLALQPGDAFTIDGGSVRVTRVDEGARAEEHTIYNPNRGHRVEVLAGPMTVELTSEGRNGPGLLCG